MRTFIVLDLEWNQCPEGKDKSVQEIPFEIIEIGAIKLDESWNILSDFKSLVNPSVYKKIHYRVQEVIDLRMKDLRNSGKPFRQVMNDFLKWAMKKGEEPIFCTWGMLDLLELQRNMDYHKVPNPFPFPFLYYDVQKLYSLQNGNSASLKFPLDKAVLEIGLSIDNERTFHHAYDDAYYTMMVLRKMDFASVAEYVSVDYYRLPEKREDEIYLEFSNYTKYVTMPHKSREELFKDSDLKPVPCVKCKKKLRKKIHWFTNSLKICSCLAYCPEHGYMRGKIRIKEKADESIYGIKTIKMISLDAAEEIRKKKENLSRKRARKNRIKRMQIKNSSYTNGDKE